MHSRLRNVFTMQCFAARSSLHVKCKLSPHLGVQERDAAVPVHVRKQIGMHHALCQHVIGTRLETMCQYILTAQAIPKQSC